MKIKSLEIINVKSFEKSIITFSENINLLIGANNSGKSTVIKSLLNLQYNTFSQSDIRVNQRYAKTFIEIVDVSQKEYERFYKQSSENKFVKKVDYTVCWGISGVQAAEEYLFYNSRLKSQRLGYNRMKIFDAELEIQPDPFSRFPDKENENNFIYPFLSKRKADQYDLTIGHEQTYKVSDNLKSLTAKIEKIGNSSNPQNEEFISLCKDILGFKIGAIPVYNNSSGMEPGIYTDNNSTLSLRSMGDGVANILGLIVILLTENDKLFLIEELENDIHPEALKKLLNLIISKSRNNQFIISTHSNIVLKYLGTVPNSKMFYLDWKPYTIVDELKENIPTSTIEEIENNPENRIVLMEKLGYSFIDFELHESYLLLEEASAESIIRDFLIPNFVPSLYGKIKTIAAKGIEDLETRVIDFNRLFVFIHTTPIYYKKAWIIADGDEVGNECIKRLQKDFDKWPEEHFINFTKKCFEEYYPDKFKAQVNSTLNLPHGKAKQQAKKNILHEVMNWALNNREEAITEFEKSASEVISILKEIDYKLNAKK